MFRFQDTDRRIPTPKQIRLDDCPQHSTEDDDTNQQLVNYDSQCCCRRQSSDIQTAGSSNSRSLAVTQEAVGDNILNDVWPAGNTGQIEISNKCSKKLYKLMAEGICKLSSECRCDECQSHYFDCDFDNVSNQSLRAFNIPRLNSPSCLAEREPEDGRWPRGRDPNVHKRSYARNSL